MKTLKFSIHSTSNKFDFPDYIHPFKAYRVTLENTQRILGQEGYYLQNYLVEVFPGNPHSEGDVMGNYFRGVIFPDFLKEVSTACGDDPFYDYDYRPDYVDMLHQYIAQFGVMDRSIFKELMEKINDALHLINAGWATDKDQDRERLTALPFTYKLINSKTTMTISESLDQASNHQLKAVLESILTAFTENRVEVLRKSDIQDILQDEGLIIPSLIDPVPLSDQKALWNKIQDLDSNEMGELIIEILQECGRAPICPKNLPDILEERGIQIYWDR